MTAASASSSVSSTLLALARKNDPQAWARLCEVTAPLVYDWCRRASLQDSDALDVGQEVFRVVAGRIGSFRRDVDGGSFRGWLWTITNNKLRDHFRRRVDVPGFDVDGPAGAALLVRLQELEARSTATQPAEQNAALVQRILELLRTDFDEQAFQAFWRTTVDGQPSSAVAQELGTTPGAVRQAKFRVLKRLREELQDLL